MHQHPRSSAPSGSSFPSRRISTRPDDQRGQEVRMNTPPGNSNNVGSEAGTESPEHAARSTGPPKDAISKLSQLLSVRTYCASLSLMCIKC